MTETCLMLLVTVGAPIYLTVAPGGPSGPTVPNWVKFCRLLDVNKGNKVWQSD